MEAETEVNPDPDPTPAPPAGLDGPVCHACVFFFHGAPSAVNPFPTLCGDVVDKVRQRDKGSRIAPGALRVFGARMAAWETCRHLVTCPRCRAIGEYLAYLGPRAPHRAAWEAWERVREREQVEHRSAPPGKRVLAKHRGNAQGWGADRDDM